MLDWAELKKPANHEGQWARKLQSVSPPDYVIVRVPYVVSQTGEFQPRYVVWHKGHLLDVQFSPDDAKTACNEHFAKNRDA